VAGVDLCSSYNALRDIARTLSLFKDHLHTTLEGKIGVLQAGSEMDQEAWAEQMAEYRESLMSKINGNRE
jgi:hypothetical protein